MALSPGDRLGSYECIALLGKGGMGEVYRARDLKLNRDVAIKVLPAAYIAKGDSFAAGPPRVWTEMRLRTHGFGRNFDVTPDGKRLAAILLVDANSENRPTRLTFLLHFFDELRRKAPVQ